MQKFYWVNFRSLASVSRSLQHVTADGKPVGDRPVLALTRTLNLSKSLRRVTRTRHEHTSKPYRRESGHQNTSGSPISTFQIGTEFKLPQRSSRTVQFRVIENHVGPALQ